MSKRGAKSAPITKPTSIIPAKWLAIHPVENHAKLQVDVNRLMVAECKLKKKSKLKKTRAGPLALSAARPFGERTYAFDFVVIHHHFFPKLSNILTREW